ncbi:MAG: PDZ domain-containing protein [Planctomycetota bacterium]
MRRAFLAVPSLALVLLACSAAAPGQETAAPAATARPPADMPDATMLRFPDVGRERIVFVYANDLWTVDRAGGQAAPLASPPGPERFPKFSPDDATIAFMGNYEGGRDLYTLPAIGGVPVRATHHPTTEFLCDWTPDGRLLFYAGGLSGLGRQQKIFTVGSGGGLPAILPLPYGTVSAISPDGAWLAYTPHTADARTWKRYRGGMATDIWLFHLTTHESRKITDWEGTDSLPMWHGDTIYYLSDDGEGHKLNIWSYELGSGRRAQVTRFAAYDVKWPSIGPGDRGQGEIVLQNGPWLYLVDLGTKEARQVHVTVPGALPTLRPRQIDAADFVQDWNVSATGKRAVVQARGDIWTLPAEKGSPRNLTRTSGIAERSPSWSPDGRWIAYFTDATGEYELYVTQSDGKGEARQMTAGQAPYWYYASWSPDSKRMVIADKAWRLFLVTLETAEVREIDRDPWAMGVGVNWSHDSQWITWARGVEDDPLPRIWLYDLEKDEKHVVTSGMFADSSPVFDRRGDYLFFASSRAFSYTDSDVFFSDDFLYEDTEQILAVPLLAEVEAPWLAESDEEKWGEEKEKGEGDENGKDGEGDDEADAEGDEAPAKDAAGAARPADPVSGTWEGTAETPDGPVPFILTLVLSADNRVTGSLTSAVHSGDVSGTWNPDAHTLDCTLEIPGEAVIVFALSIEDGEMSGTGTTDMETVSVHATRTSTDAGGDEAGDEKDKKNKIAREKVEIVLDGFERRAFALPVARGRFHSLAVNDQNQLLYVRVGAGIKLFDLEDDKKAEKTVAAASGGFAITADGKKLLVPAGNAATIHKAAADAEGKKVVTAGMDVAIEPRAEWRQIFLDVWRLQRDFFYVENMHGVDWPGVRDRYLPMLDACVSREDVSYVLGEMIAELNVGHTYYSGGDVDDEPKRNVGLLGVDWELDQGAYRIARIVEGAPWDVDARNPLNRQGVDVHAGDWLLAVNGVPVDVAQDPWAAFVDLAGKTITVTVSAKPVLDDDAREVAIEPLADEGELRYRAWIERNRAYVAEKTGNQVGYLYVPDTAVSGRNDFMRQYSGQLRRKALIVDERWNSGGFDPSCFVQRMNKPITNFWARRDGHDLAQPFDAHQGPKCMLINGLAGSGGDDFPWQFRHARLGKLIGMRTWGGLVGIGGNPGLIDGAETTVPNYGFYELDGTWGVEGHGVDPDIEVVDDPSLMVDGGDPQLDAAISLMLEEIPDFDYIVPERPPDPDRSGMGLPAADR